MGWRANLANVGPFITSPSGVKREPWQGQPQLRSTGFQWNDAPEMRALCQILIAPEPALEVLERDDSLSWNDALELYAPPRAVWRRGGGKALSSGRGHLAHARLFRVRDVFRAHFL